MSEITEAVLIERLDSIGLSLTPSDEAGVLEFTRRVLREGQSVGAAVAVAVHVHPLFSIADPELFSDAPDNDNVQNNESEGF